MKDIRPNWQNDTSGPRAALTAGVLTDAHEGSLDMTNGSSDSTRIAQLEIQLTAAHAAVFVLSQALNSAIEEHPHDGRERMLMHGLAWTGSQDLEGALERHMLRPGTPQIAVAA